VTDSFFELSASDNKGAQVPMKRHAGKVLLVVNTASKCGFTPQYKGLEALHRKYKDRGLVVLGFPSDQFAHQEPGSDAEIASFCQVNYGVTFPLMSKVAVNGKGAHPVFAFLKSKTSRFLGGAVKWNFTKFLVGRDGKTVKRYSPATDPGKLEGDVEAAISA
jgi:glutathione peroxidase